ncbi:MAG: FHA domain-containing protein [Lentisphaerae bacterium]|nr:FHA domain-containing protein [Lentisphaerota bacterium]
MVKAIITAPGTAPVTATLENGAYIIGASSSCHIPIQVTGISRRHAQLIVSDGRITVMDLGSSNGTKLNGGEAIFPNRPVDISGGATLTLGKAFLQVIPLKPHEEEKLSETQLKNLSQTQIDQKQSMPKPFSVTPEKEEIPVFQISAFPPELRPVIQEIKRQAHRELLIRMNLKKMALSGISQEDLAKKAQAIIQEILSQLTIPLPGEESLQQLEKELLQEAIGLGPLEPMLERDDITEIMVNGPNQIFIERKGVIYRSDSEFADDAQVLSAIERIVAPLGRRIDESSPMVDARLADGSRVNAIIPPLALTGPTITIRKFAKKPFQAKDLINFGSISEDMMHFLAICIAVRKNIIISGGTGSGKTTLLNVLSSFLPNRERIVTIEDAAELQLHQEHLVRLESRPPNIEGRGAVTIRDLVRNSLRMRPDRIVVGECRGGEALDMLQAMNTGHDGSLTTVHANTPRDALARLETLVLMAGFDLPLRAIREQIASAINIVVQITRARDGSRKVINISEITKMEGDIITMQDIFTFHHTGWDSNGKMTGKYLPTGNIPSFMEDITRAKLDLSVDIFTPPKD